MKASTTSENGKWLLLIHQIPSGSNRVKIWRRLQKIGAIPFKNSVYILPYTKEACEDFQWIRKEIIAQKGDAAVFKAGSVEGVTDKEIVRQFQRVRSKDYDEVIAAALRFKRNIQETTKKKQITATLKEKYNSELKKLKERLNEAVFLDYFHAPNKEKAEKAVAECDEIVGGIKMVEDKKQGNEASSPVKIYNKKDFQNKTWATRKGIHIDRIASGWLIKRFIDKGAKFFFFEEGRTVKKGIGFDVYDGEFTHRGDNCTFEVLLKSFGIKDMVLHEIAEVVHDVDLKDGKFGRTDAEGINHVILALSRKLRNDHRLLERGMEIFDSLYQYHSPPKVISGAQMNPTLRQITGYSGKTKK